MNWLNRDVNQRWCLAHRLVIVIKCFLFVGLGILNLLSFSLDTRHMVFKVKLWHYLFLRGLDLSWLCKRYILAIYLCLGSIYFLIYNWVFSDSWDNWALFRVEHWLLLPKWLLLGLNLHRDFLWQIPILLFRWSLIVILQNLLGWVFIECLRCVLVQSLLDCKVLGLDVCLAFLPRLGWSLLRLFPLDSGVLAVLANRDIVTSLVVVVIRFFHF